MTCTCAYGGCLEHAPGNTFENYLRAVHHVPREQRRGQWAFNVLHEMRPDLSDHVRGNVELDPFHQDSKLPAFLEWVANQWDMP